MAGATTPPGLSVAKVRGPSAADVLAQRRADAEMEGLLASESPTAPIKAFARGLAAGATLPLALGVLNWTQGLQGDIADAKHRAYLAHMLHAQGIPKEDAHRAAVGALHYLKRTEETPVEVKKALSAAVSGLKFTPDAVAGMPEDIREQLSKAVFSNLDAVGARLGKDPSAFEGLLTNAAPPPATVKLGPTAEQSRRVLGDAQASFYAAVKKNPDLMKEMPSSLPVIGRGFGKALKGALPMAAVFGIPAGIVAALQVKKKRKALRELRAAQGEKTAEDASLLDRGLAVAPAAAAVPGFMIGAADTQSFEPSNLIGQRAQRMLGHHRGIKSRMVSGLIGASAAASAASLPGVAVNAARAVKPAEKRAEAEEDPSLLERGIQAAPGAAVAPGFLMGASDTAGFNASRLLGSRAEALLGPAGGIRSRMVSGTMGAVAASAAAGLPRQVLQSYNAVGSKPANPATTPIIMQKQSAVHEAMANELAEIYGAL